MSLAIAHYIQPLHCHLAKPLCMCRRIFWLGHLWRLWWSPRACRMLPWLGCHLCMVSMAHLCLCCVTQP